MLALSCASCAPALYDQVTVDHLSAIKGLGRADADSCKTFVDYEAVKKAADPPKFDKGSLRNVQSACDCIAQAPADTSSIERKSCATKIDAFIAREHAKRSL
jgi:hypothetical protein